jgi:outer membrane protein OmpA-like peptidoglycan-associated protein
VRIVGHADARGDAAHNEALGADRARAVRGLLVSLGVSPVRAEVSSEGARSPARGAEASEADQLRDRRVEIFVVPSTREEEEEEEESVAHAP